MIALFTALIAPYFVDWTSYKKDFERETSRIVGQKVEVLGETKLRLLPLPSITFGGLSIGRNPDKTPMMTVDQFTMDVELMPLLKREIKIVKLHLVRPRVNLHVDESGAIAWTNRQQFAVNPEQIKLENFTVTNGEMKIHGLVAGRTISLEQLDGRISAKSLYGPWRIGAEGYFGEKRARIDFVTGHLQEDNSIRVKLSAKWADLPYKLSLDGAVQVADGLLRWDGEYELEGLNSEENQRVQALPIFSQGKFSAQPHAIEVPEFRLEIGARDDPYTITGAGSAKIEETISFVIGADGRQIDLDRVGQSESNNAENGGQSLEQRIAVLRSIIEQIPVPPAQGIIDLSLPAIVAGDTLIRDVSALISPQTAGWEIIHIGAILPGNTKFEANGKVGLGDAFGFSGHMVVASRQPTGLAAWLGKRNDPFIRKLHSAGFSADVVISDNQTSLEHLELILDAAVLEGKLQRLSGNGKRPVLVAALEGSQINLDDLRAIFALMADDSAKAITNHDLDISLKAGKLVGFDISAEKFETRFQVIGGSVSVEKLNASNFFGATIASSGRIDDLLKQPNGKFDLTVNAKNPGRLLQFIQSKVPDNRYLDNLAQSSHFAEDLDLKFTINARALKDSGVDGSKGQAFITGRVGGTIVNIETTFEGKPDDVSLMKMDVVSRLENDNPGRLLAQLDFPVLPVDVSGPLTISGIFGGVPKDGFSGVLSADMSGTKFEATGSVHPIGVKAGDADFKITHSARDLSPVMILGGFGVPSLTYGAQEIPSSLTANVVLANNTIKVNQAQGQINGREFSLDLEFTKSAASNHRISGKLAASSIDLPLLAQFAFNSRQPSGIGEVTNQTNGWSETNFGFATLQGLDGKIDLTVANSDLGIGEPATNLEGELALVDGSINLNDIKGEWLDGRFEANLSLTNSAGIGSLSAQYHFTDIDAQTLTRAVDAKNFIQGRIDVLGDLEGSGRSASAITSSLTGSGTVDLKNVVVDGVNTSPLAHIFKAADQEGFEILDENVLPVLVEVIDAGEITAPAISIPFIVAIGKLRARNISFETRKAQMVGAVEIDLKNKMVNSDLSVRFDPGKAWIEGADAMIVMGWEGAISSPARSIDVQPLSGFLSLRNFEREQRRVDLLQASILEKQRLRRDIIITNARVQYRQRLREEELRRQRLALRKREEARLRVLATQRHEELLSRERELREEVRRKAEEARRARLAEEARIAAERKRLAEEARIAAERKRLAEEARIAAEAERKRLAEEARIAAERKRLAEEARIAAERKRLAEEARMAAEAERKREEDAARIAAEAERKRLAEEVRKAEEARKAQAERMRLKNQERIAAMAEHKRLAQEAKEAEQARKAKAEQVRKAKAEQVRKAKAEQMRKAKAGQKRKTEEARIAAEAKHKSEQDEAERVSLGEITRRKEEARRIQQQLDGETSNTVTGEINTTPAKNSASIKKTFAERVDDFLNSR